MRKNQYASEKRRKELDRKKKKEEKKLRRLNRNTTAENPEESEGLPDSAEDSEKEN